MRESKHLRSAVFLISFIIYSIVVSAQSRYSSIKGIITTAEGAPAAGVSVAVKNTGRNTVTGKDGSYVINNLSPGIYTLKITYNGSYSREKEVSLRSGQVTGLDFILDENSERLSEVLIVAGRNNFQRPSIGKIDMNPMDLPQSISIVNSRIIREQQASRLSDVMKNVNGVSMADSRGSTSEAFFARGYNLGSNNYFKNGARYNSASIPEVSTLEQVEVLKGSAALLYGNVSGGAVINLVTKKPKFEPGAEISMRLGSHNAYKPSADIYGPLTENLAFRLIGTYEDNESFRNGVESGKYYFNPSLLYKAGLKTDILLQGDYLDYEVTPDFGIGSLDGKIPTSIPRSSFFNAPWAYNKVNQSTASATIDHRVNSGWKLGVIGSYQSFNRNYFSTERIQADETGDWSRSLTRSKIAEDYYAVQANFTGKFVTGKIAHNLLTGADADFYLNTSHTFNYDRAYDKINILDPSKYSPRTDMPLARDSLRSTVPTYRFGYYVQDMLTFSEKIKFMAGIRWSWQQALVPDITNLVSGMRTKDTGAAKTDQAFSPRFGFVYQPVKTTSLFASYSNNFTVNKGVDIYDRALSPSIINQYEIGVKNDLFNGLLSANFTVYRIVNNNLAQQAQFLKDGTVNTDSNIKELSGETTSEGAEIDLSGVIFPGLNFMGGYSYNFMRFTRTSGLRGSYIEGERLVSNPAHTANASLFYNLNIPKIKGIRIGASAYYTGERNAGWNNTVGQSQTGSRLIPLSGFTTYDLSVGFSRNKLSLLGRLSNITNTLNYYVHENYSVNPIAPRQFSATVSYKF